jgi:hypothetical protein
MVYWYEFAAKDLHAAASPSAKIFRYKWRCQYQEAEEKGDDSSTLPKYDKGKRVYVQPRGARCKKPWSMGTVTASGDGASLEVNGFPRHISDVRVNVDQSSENCHSENDGSLERFRDRGECEH